jgi:hypothetical protein
MRACTWLVSTIKLAILHAYGQLSMLVWLIDGNNLVQVEDNNTNEMIFIICLKMV